MSDDFDEDYPGTLREQLKRAADPKENPTHPAMLLEIRAILERLDSTDRLRGKVRLNRCVVRLPGIGEDMAKHPPKPRPVTQYWMCRECGESNHPFDLRCAQCGTAKFNK